MRGLDRETNKAWMTGCVLPFFSYNVLVHKSTGFAPYTPVFGKEANIPSSFVKEKLSIT